MTTVARRKQIQYWDKSQKEVYHHAYAVIAYKELAVRVNISKGSLLNKS